ncbi:hypothetical protein K3725_15880 [Leisingera sp. S132]|uniref:hypothetical protein n=1 Tax=Leisingera sp. S132 TaxID=2867016 RepID=UPI0021A54901|nr:hypothetical protein [Leisingera sp. S132]UWQ78767.1 hypothetical protein K3725_15880 [Leisingera sp. S132]
MKLIAIVAVLLITSAATFVAGWYSGQAAQFQVSLEIDATGDAAGRIAAYESGWDAFEVASAICETHSEMSGFHHTYAITGSGQHFMFTCRDSGKDT